jgi:hypothetical protein
LGENAEGKVAGNSRVGCGQLSVAKLRSLIYIEQTFALVRFSSPVKISPVTGVKLDRIRSEIKVSCRMQSWRGDCAVAAAEDGGRRGERACRKLEASGPSKKTKERCKGVFGTKKT